MMAHTRAGTALVSVHDVRPAVRPAIDVLMAFLRRKGCCRPALLIIPGVEWNADDLDWLRALEASGAVLVAHGWRHRAVPLPRTPAHRLHSALFSRNAAEHLSHTPETVAAMMRRSADWFTAHGFRTPHLYVPPAWALGQTDRRALEALPFEMIETLSGIRHRDGTYRRLPLAGFEADTPARALALRLGNALNVGLARVTRLPLRLAIHPHDLALRLRGDLEKRLGNTAVFLPYDALTRKSQPD